MLNFLIESSYYSTPDKDGNLYGCEFNGLAELDCGKKGFKMGPIRSVTLAGLFTDTTWATNGKSLSLEEAKGWYTSRDFEEMKGIGLNTVQIPVPASIILDNDGYKDLLDKILVDIEGAGLQVILLLVGTGDEEDAILACAKYAVLHPVILGVTLPDGMLIDTELLISSIRVEAPVLPIFLPLKEGDILHSVVSKIGESDPNVYGSLDLTHTTTIADIASSSSIEDRSKMFYHEATSCIKRSPLEFSYCIQNLPIFVSNGFDASIDDCFMNGYKDYGQCDRFNETMYSDWWERHRASYLARQFYAYERGLGWSFATWKLYDSSNEGVIDIPAKLFSLKDVVSAGIFPDMDGIPAVDACLNPPENDFMLGDDTLAPTMGPPPDCGDGWWNFTTSQ